MHVEMGDVCMESERNPFFSNVERLKVFTLAYDRFSPSIQG